MVLPDSHALQWLADNSTSISPGQTTLYGMFALLGIAIIGGIVNFLTARMSAPRTRLPSSPAALTKIKREHDAWERFLIGEVGVDPRRIKTGYEKLEDVRRA